MCAWLAVVLLLVAGNDWFGRWAAASLERRYQPPDPKLKADAILLVGDRSVTKQWPWHVLNTTAAGDRAVAAFDLFRQGRARLLLCTGGKEGSGERAVSDAEETRTLLESFGVPEQAILVETNSTTMVEMAGACRKLLESKHVRRLFLVGTARHLPMTVAVFGRECFDVELFPVPIGFIYPDKPEVDGVGVLRSCVPTADHLFKSEQILREYLQMLTGALVKVEGKGVLPKRAGCEGHRSHALERSFTVRHPENGQGPSPCPLPKERVLCRRRRLANRELRNSLAPAALATATEVQIRSSATIPSPRGEEGERHCFSLVIFRRCALRAGAPHFGLGKVPGSRQSSAVPVPQRKGLCSCDLL